MTTKQLLGILASIISIIAGAVTIYALSIDHGEELQQVSNINGVVAGRDAIGNTIEHNTYNAAGELENKLIKYAANAVETCRQLSADIQALPSRPTSIPSAFPTFLPPEQLYPPEELANRRGESEFRSLSEQFKTANGNFFLMHSALTSIEVAKETGLDTAGSSWDKHYESFHESRQKTVSRLNKLCELWEHVANR